MRALLSSNFTSGLDNLISERNVTVKEVDC